MSARSQYWDPAHGAGVTSASPPVPYNDPHLAWLVATYLYTPEGQEAVAAFYGLKPAAPVGYGQVPAAAYGTADSGDYGYTTSGDPAGSDGGQAASYAEPEPQALIHQAPSQDAGTVMARWWEHPAVFVAACAILIIAGGLGGALMIPDESADARPAAALHRTYNLLVACPFMEEELKLDVEADSRDAAVVEAQRQLPGCAVATTPSR